LNINEVKDFFNYHYDYTPNKETYLDYLEFGIINHKWFNEGGIREFVKRLIDEKRKKNEQLIYENKIAVQILGYGKQNISSKNQTVLNYIDSLLIENDLKPIDAIKILNKSTSNFSPEFKDAHFKNIIDYLKSIDVNTEPQQSKDLPLNTNKYDKTNSENFTTKIWFKVGLMFATGEMNVLIKKHDNVFTRVASELNNASYRPYISDTFGGNAKGDKNIYESKSKMTTIHDYCKMKGIKMTEDFLDKIKAIKD
jgi:hypothetical protein